MRNQMTRVFCAFKAHRKSPVTQRVHDRNRCEIDMHVCIANTFPIPKYVPPQRDQISDNRRFVAVISAIPVVL